MYRDTRKYVDKVRLENVALVTQVYDLEQRVEALQKENTHLSLFNVPTQHQSLLISK